MIKKQMRWMVGGRRAGVGAAAALMVGGWAASAQAQAQQYPVPSGGNFPTAPQVQLPQLPAPQAITPNGQVVEDVIARVNDQIITRSEYERAEQGLLQTAQQQHLSQADLDDQQKNLLRDMIDQQLLLSKGKELDISGEAETLHQLDEIRKQNHLDSMEALQKAAEQQGVSFEDFKQNIKDHIITQQVVRDEVGRHISLTHAEEETYYDAHKQEFSLPEQVHLSEILIATPDNATDAQIAAAQAKADDAEAKLKGGESFAELAKAVSGGPTASAGGDLGDFKRGALGKVLEDATFSLPVGAVTQPIRTRQGFVILRVASHQAPGVPPLANVEPQVQEAIYVDAMQPALRAYLTKQRDEAYVDIKPGFVDSGSNKKEAKPTFTAYAPPPPKKKVVEKQRMEQKKAQQAEAELAAARERTAEKAVEKAAENARKAGDKNVAMPVKAKKIRKEKIRYGQAPRVSLPEANVATTTEVGAPLSGQAPGVAMAANDSITSISTGAADDSLTPKTVSDHKARFSDREKQAEEEKAKTKTVKAVHHAQERPLQATSAEVQDEKHQAAPLGLNGDTSAKKRKHVKGDPKERLQEKPAPTPPPTVTPEATVNPTLTASPVKSTTTTSTTTDQPAATMTKP
jgi:peptidyl-prolyl cis-trans isomerase SurA